MGTVGVIGVVATAWSLLRVNGCVIVGAENDVLENEDTRLCVLTGDGREGYNIKSDDWGYFSRIP